MGIGIAMKKDYLAPLIVVDVLKGGPAETAGLKKGDLITAVDDQAVYNFPLAEVANWIKGKPNSVVKLTVLRNDKLLPKPITVIRQLVNIHS